MSALNIRLQSPGVYLLSGELTLANVGELLGGDILPLSAGERQLKLDLSQINHVDSSGLALLIAWTREAKKQGCSLSFCGISGKMASLARVTGVDRVLSLQ